MTALRNFLLACGIFFLTLAAAGPAAGQDLGTDCDLPQYRVIESDVTRGGHRITWIGGPFLLVCPDGLRIRADSAVVYEETGRNHLMGRVRFDTPERELRSREADYFERTGRLHARGDVEFRDLIRGSEVRGDTLDYLEATDFRPEDEVDVRGGRPSAVLPRMDLPEGEEDPDPYRVTAERLRFEGDRFLWADDDVEVLREGMRAVSDSLTFDRGAGNLLLVGRARVTSDDGDFEGERIDMLLPDDVLESIVIRERGRLRTEDLDLRGEEIRIQLEDEKIQRLVAVHRPGEGGGERPRPRAVTEDFILEADSVDVLSPGELLERVNAVGTARAETRRRNGEPLPVGRGELEALPDAPRELERLAGLPDRDYMEGHEIVATFVPVDPPEEGVAEQRPDAGEGASSAPGARREYRLDTLEAIGEARSLYRSAPEREDGDNEETPVEEWSVSYILADRISIHMMQGEVDRMEAEGQVRILHLDPQPQGEERRGTGRGGRP
jgi:hypothetical protein